MTRDVDVAAIGEVLVAHGHDPGLAAQWAKAGRRPGLVELYCRVGVWHPDAAEAADNAGLGVGELAHHQARSWGDTLDQLNQAIAWYDSDEAADGSYDPADLAAAKACLEAVRERHAGEAAAGAEQVPLPWEVEDNRLSRYRQPQVRVAVALIETTEGVLEVWPGGEDHHLYRAEAFYDPDEGDGRRRPAPCRLHHGVALDDHDAVSVLEDFLEAHIDTGLGIGNRRTSTCPTMRARCQPGSAWSSTSTAVTPTGASRRRCSATCSEPGPDRAVQADAGAEAGRLGVARSPMGGQAVVLRAVL